jgi:3-hydroxyisobutyrate dehydrogenase
MATIGMVGLGAMGGPMARNLLTAGHRLKVYDKAEAAVETLVVAGAQPATQDSVARDVDVVITMLRTGDVVAAVLSGAAGLLARAKPDTLFIESSTIDVNIARVLATEAIAAGMAMVDAPVSGGVPGAEAATLTFMVGGEEGVASRATPILEAMGRSIVHVGAAGAGQAAKICNNMILGISTIAVAEAFRLADKLGLEANTFNEIVANSSGNCWVLNANHPVPDMSPTSAANNDYRPGFSSSLMLKDLLLSQNAAGQFGAYTPMGARAAELYRDFVETGNAELDYAGIIKQIEAQESKR